MSSRPAAVAEVNTSVDADGIINIADGNIKKRIVKEGTGSTPTDRSDVTVHYTGRLLDGTVFDSSKKRNEPFVFKIGQGQVIKGWDQGVATMRVGEHAFLTCSPEYAYGARGSPPTIPPNATLEFEVELLSYDNTQKVTEDGGVKKSIKQAGTGHARPNDQATVVVKYTGRVKGSEKAFVEVTEPTTLKLGTDPTQIWGFEEGVKNMHEGERSALFIQPSYGLPQGDSTRGIPANAELEYDVELISLTKAKESGEMNFDDKLAYMTSLKDFGNGLYKLGYLPRACVIYTKVVKDVFPYDGHLEEEQKKKVDAVKIAAISNNTLCKLKQLDYEAVIQHANAGLAIDPRHVKCLFYRAQAYHKLGQISEAEADLRLALSVDPKNRDVSVLYNSIKAKQKAVVDQERKAFGGFFNKVKLVTEEETKQAEKERLQAEERKKRAEDADSSDDAEMESEPDEPTPAAAPATTEAK